MFLISELLPAFFFTAKTSSDFSGIMSTVQLAVHQIACYTNNWYWHCSIKKNLLILDDLILKMGENSTVFKGAERKE